MVHKSKYLQNGCNLRKLLFIALFAMAYCNGAYAQQSKELPKVIALAEEFSQQGMGIIYDEKKNSALLFLGVAHTHDAGNYQIGAIEQFIKNFRPTLILNEGGDPPIEASKELAVQRYAEAGLLRFLANQSQTKMQTFEPILEDEMAAVLKQHSAVDAKLYYALRMVPQWSEEENKQSIDQKMTSFLSKEKSVKNFGANFPVNIGPNDVAELTQLCALRLPGLKDWRKIDFAYSDPGLKGSFFHRIKTTSSAYRDRALEKALFSAMEGGERVVIVAGAMHLGGTLSNISKKLAQME